MIQAGLPTMTFGSMPQLMDEVAWEEQIGNSLVVREPVGVVGAITPWNYPLHQIAAKVAPALAAGCTVVLKPSEVVPLNAFILAEVIEEAGLPAGVFNLVTRHRARSSARRSPAHPGRRHGLLHRLDPGRQAGLRAGRGDGQAGRARAGRQVAERDPRRRRLRAGGAGRRRQVLPQLGPDLQRADPDARPAREARGGRARSPRRRPSSSPSATRSTPATRLGPLVSDVQRERVRGYIAQGRRGGREARHRRRRGARRPRARLLRAADRLLRGHARR